MIKDTSKEILDNFKKVNKEASAAAKTVADEYFKVSLKNKIRQIYLTYKFNIETITLKDDDSSKDISKRIPTIFEYTEDNDLYTTQVKASTPLENRILKAGFQGTAISVSEDIIEYFLDRIPTEEEKRSKYIDPNGMKTVFENAIKLELKR